MVIFHSYVSLPEGKSGLSFSEVSMRGARVDDRRLLRKLECFNGHVMFIHKINPGDRPSPGPVVLLTNVSKIPRTLVDKTRISCQ